MSEEKPFSPSRRKLEKARADGNILKAPLATQLAVFTSVLCAAFYFVNDSWVRTQALINYCSIGSLRDVSFCSEQALLVCVRILLGSLGAGAVAAFFSEVLQVGVISRPSLALPRLLRLNPGQGVGKIFQSLKQTWLPCSKLLLGSMVVIVACRPAMIQLGDIGLWSGAAAILSLKAAVVWLIVSGIGIAILISAAEGFFRWRSYYRELGMTADELRHELKEEEGDPLVKGTRRSLHESILHENLARRVRQAKVIVVERSAA